MKKLSVLILSMMLLAFTGCFAAPEPSVSPTDEQPEAELEAIESSGIIAEWFRTGNYADGELINTASSITTLMDDGTYISTGTCLVQGTYGFDVVDEQDVMIMTITSTDCQGASAGYSVTWIYDITEDGQNMTLTTNIGGVTVKETFIRQ